MFQEEVSILEECSSLRILARELEKKMEEMFSMFEKKFDQKLEQEIEKLVPTDSIVSCQLENDLFSSGDRINVGDIEQEIEVEGSVFENQVCFIDEKGKAELVSIFDRSSYQMQEVKLEKEGSGLTDEECLVDQKGQGNFMLECLKEDDDQPEGEDFMSFGKFSDTDSIEKFKQSEASIMCCGVMKSPRKMRRLRFDPGIDWYALQIQGYKHFYKRALLESFDYLKDDSLKINCPIGVEVSAIECSRFHSIQVPDFDIESQYGFLWDNKESSSFILKVAGESFHAAIVKKTIHCLNKVHDDMKSIQFDPGGKTLKSWKYKYPGNVYVEGDASNASYFLDGATITSGTVTVEGCGTRGLQGDVETAAEAVVKMGIEVTLTETSVTMKGPPRNAYVGKHFQAVVVTTKKGVKKRLRLKENQISFQEDMSTMVGLTLAAGGWMNKLLVYLVNEVTVKSVDSAQTWKVENGCTCFVPITLADYYLDCYSSFSSYYYVACPILPSVQVSRTPRLDILAIKLPCNQSAGWSRERLHLQLAAARLASFAEGFYLVRILYISDCLHYLILIS